MILAVEKRITSPLMEPTSIGKADACCSSLLVTHRLVFSSNDVYHLCSHGHFSPAEKIVEIDSHIACAFSGLTADSKTLIDRYQICLKCSVVFKVQSKYVFKKNCRIHALYFVLRSDLYTPISPGPVWRARTTGSPMMRRCR